MKGGKNRRMIDVADEGEKVEGKRKIKKGREEKKEEEMNDRR